MVHIVIELPDQHKTLGPALQHMAARVQELAKRGAHGKAIDYAKIEREVGAVAAEIERVLTADIFRRDLTVESGPRRSAIPSAPPGLPTTVGDEGRGPRAAMAPKRVPRDLRHLTRLGRGLDTPGRTAP